MSRTTIIIIGAFLWAAVGIDIVVHFASGDWLADVIVLAAFVAAMAFFRIRDRSRRGTSTLGRDLASA